MSWMLGPLANKYGGGGYNPHAQQPQQNGGNGDTWNFTTTTGGTTPTPTTNTVTPPAGFQTPAGYNVVAVGPTGIPTLRANGVMGTPGGGTTSGGGSTGGSSGGGWDRHSTERQGLLNWFGQQYPNFNQRLAQLLNRGGQ